MENIKLKKSNSFNITYLIIFIIFFTAIFPFVETLKDKSNKKRLLKREVNAISGLIEKKCLKKKDPRHFLNVNSIEEPKLKHLCRGLNFTRNNTKS